MRPNGATARLVIVGVLAVSGCGGVASHASIAPDDSAPHKSVLIGRGVTFAGTAFVAMLQRAADCPLTVTIEESGPFGHNRLCYSDFENPERPKVKCLPGLLAIHMRVLGATRSVRLTLSSGVKVTSPVLMVPRRLGGPAKLYYQAVRGPGPIPVSLTELDAERRPMQTMAVRRLVECTKQLVKPVRNATHILVEGRAPDGRKFSISSTRTRILGRTYFGLMVAFHAPGATGGVGSAALRLAPPLKWDVRRVCKPNPFAIIYGVLTSTGDEVLVRSGNEFHILRRVKILASVLPHSVLVYGVLVRSANDLIVRNSGGRTVVNENVGPIFAATPCV